MLYKGCLSLILITAFFKSYLSHAGFMPKLRVYAPEPSKLPSIDSEIPHDQQPYDFDSIDWKLFNLAMVKILVFIKVFYDFTKLSEEKVFK